MDCFLLHADCYCIFFWTISAVVRTHSLLSPEFQATFFTKQSALACFCAIISADSSFQAWWASGHVVYAVIRRRIPISEFLHIISLENPSNIELLCLVGLVDGRMIFIFEFICDVLKIITISSHSAKTITIIIHLENLFGYEKHWSE